MSRKILKWIDGLLPVVIICLLVFWMAKTAHAQGALGEGWSKYIEGTGVQKFQAPGSGEDVAKAVLLRGVTLVKYGMAGVALIFGILYASSLVFARGNEDTIGKQKKNFLWAFMGFVILMVASGISDVFNPEKATSDALINFQAARDQLRNITDYLKWMLGSIIVLLMTISGIRMITASGNEETIKKQKMNLVWSGIGMLVILLASNIVNAIYVVKGGEAAPAATTTAATEIGGIIRLILVFLGPVAVLFTLYAGFYYLTAFDNEERAKKARSMIVAGVTGIVIIYAAYALVNTFYAAPELSNLSPPTPPPAATSTP
jgi:hypothetical protein